MIFSLPRNRDESGEAHECEREKTGGDKCDRGAFHRFGDLVKLKAFSDSRKNYEGEEEAESGRDGVDYALKKVVVFLRDECLIAS